MRILAFLDQGPVICHTHTGRDENDIFPLEIMLASKEICVMNSDPSGKEGGDFQHAVETGWGAEEQLLDQPLGKFSGAFTSTPAYV